MVGVKSKMYSGSRDEWDFGVRRSLSITVLRQFEKFDTCLDRS